MNYSKTTSFKLSPGGKRSVKVAGRFCRGGSLGVFRVTNPEAGGSKTGGDAAQLRRIFFYPRELL